MKSITRRSAIKAIGAILGAFPLTDSIAEVFDSTENVLENSESHVGPLLGLEQFSELKLQGKVDSRRSETIESSRWGLQVNKFAVPVDDIDLMLESIAKSGVKWVRVMTNGYAISAENGYYRTDEFDRIVDGLTKRKIEPYICINNDPDYYDLELTAESEILIQWLEYVKFLANRYHDRIKYWEIFNEPDITGNYATIVKAASKIIKGIDKDAKILAGSLVRVDKAGLKKLLNEFGVGPAIDGITYHPYNEFPEGSKYNFEVPVQVGYESSSHLVSELRDLVEKEDHPIALWQGECGYPSSENTASWKGRGPWGQYIQGKWLLRRFLTDFSMDIPVTCYFTWREFASERESADDLLTNAKGIVYYQTRDPKPAYRALQHLTSIVDQRLNKPVSLQADFKIHDEGSFYGIKGENNRDEEPFSHPKAPYPIQVIGLTGSGGEAAAFYIPWRMQEYVKPARVDILIKNISINQPILVDLLTGKVYRPKINKQREGLLLRNIPLADYPMIIMGKQLVPIKDIK